MKYLSHGKTSYIYLDNDKVIKKYYYMENSGLLEIKFAEKIKKVKGYVGMEEFNKTNKLGKYKIIPYGNIKHLESEKAYLIEESIFDGEIGEIINELSLEEIKKVFSDITKTLILLKKFDIFYNDFSLKNIFYKKVADKNIYVLADFDRLTDKPQNSYNKFIKNLELITKKYLIKEKYPYDEILKVTEDNPKFHSYLKYLFDKELNYMKKNIPSRPVELHINYTKDFISNIILDKYHDKFKIEVNENIKKFVELFDFSKIKNL